MTDFAGSAPIYVQIADALREQILVGALAEGEQVMSTTAYATTYRINPATAAKAFAGLVDEGLLEKRRGIGMFVAAGARAKLVEEGRSRYLDETLAPAVRAGLALGLSPEDVTGHARRIARKLDGLAGASTSNTDITEES